MLNDLAEAMKALDGKKEKIETEMRAAAELFRCFQSVIVSARTTRTDYRWWFDSPLVRR